jgi:CubicO group peptidase (beta-lactamase class C family)
MNRLIVSLLLLVLLAGCRSTGDEAGIAVPQSTGDGWQVASLTSVSMDQGPLVQLLRRLEWTQGHRIHGILIVKDRSLVFEQYYPGRKFNLGQYTEGTGYDRDDLHVLCSATKSVTSALLGIAIDQGHVASIEQRVFDYFPEHEDLLEGEPSKDSMTIKHLLTMTSGLTYDDESLPYSDPRNDMNRFYSSSDPIQFLLARPLFAEPGSVFDYDNCNTNILGHIIRKATGRRVDHFAREFLLGPLGIQQAEWQIVRDDVVLCSGDLHLRPRDMARIGLLFLDGGVWNGRRLISSDWCERSTRAYLDPGQFTHEFPWANGYGLHWWQRQYPGRVGVHPSFFASGWGGQQIIVVRDLNMVIVITAGNWFDPEPISPFVIVEDYVIPAARG